MSTSDLISLAGVLIAAIGVWVTWTVSKKNPEEKNLKEIVKKDEDIFDYLANENENVKDYFTRIFKQLEKDDRYSLHKLKGYPWLSKKGNISWKKTEVLPLNINGTIVYISTNRNLKPTGDEKKDKLSAQELVNKVLLEDLKKIEKGQTHV